MLISLREGREQLSMKEDPEAATKKLDKWIADARDSDMMPIRKLAKKIETP